MKQLKILLALIVTLVAVATQAAIRYTPETLRIDYNWSPIGPDIRVGLPGGLYMRGSSEGRFFKIYLPNSSDSALYSPCIAGNGVISFYDDAYGVKQWIYFREAFIMSDEYSKTDVISMPSVLDEVSNLYTSKSRRAKSVSVTASAKDMEYEYLSRVVPGAVCVVDGDTMVNYMELVPVLVKAAQELAKEIETQEQDIRFVKEQILQKKSFRSSDKILSCTPNPTFDDIMVAYTLSEMVNPHLSLVNAMGTRVLNVALNQCEDKISISLSGYPNGVYYMVLTNSGAVVDTHRIIKN